MTLESWRRLYRECIVEGYRDLPEEVLPWMPHFTSFVEAVAAEAGPILREMGADESDVPAEFTAALYVGKILSHSQTFAFYVKAGLVQGDSRVAREQIQAALDEIRPYRYFLPIMRRYAPLLDDHLIALVLDMVAQNVGEMPSG